MTYVFWTASYGFVLSMDNIDNNCNALDKNFFRFYRKDVSVLIWSVLNTCCIVFIAVSCLCYPIPSHLFFSQPRFSDEHGDAL